MIFIFKFILTVAFSKYITSQEFPLYGDGQVLNDESSYNFTQEQYSRSERQLTTSSTQDTSFSINPLVFSLYDDDEPAQTIAHITFDMRSMFNYNVTKQNLEFVYGTHWNVRIQQQSLFHSIKQIEQDDRFSYKNTFKIIKLCIIVEGEIIKWEDDDYSCIDLPVKFIKDVKKNVKIHKFSLYSMKDQQFTVLIRISSSQYQNLRLNFLNTISVNIESPKRAIYGESSSFVFYIDSKQFAVPVNAITLDKQLQVGEHLVSYEENYYSSKVLTMTNLTSTPQNPATGTPDTYFQKLDGVFMPYIPYFSNCRNFGNMGFFYEITENKKNCNLVEPENVKIINPFTFGDKPHSDECESVPFDCVLDEYLKYPNVIDNWLQQQQQTALFSVTSNPIMFNSDDANSGGISTQDLVSIEVESEIPSDQLPKKISLSINYYQTSPTEKKIIEGKIGFGSFITPSEDEASGKVPFNYTLEVSFHSMSQSELTIAFALEIQVYLVMYFIIGIASLTSICIFAGYHALSRRKKSKIKTKIKECIVTIYPGAVYGTYLTLIPVGLILFLNLLIMGGRMWDYQLNFYDCDPVSSDCQLSIFDSFRDGDISLSDDEMVQLRNGRYGVSIIVIGLYIMNFCADLLIAKNKGKMDQSKVSFDGNVWFKKYWEKSYFMFFYLVVIVIMEAIIQLSLSNNFGENVWYYLCTLKVLGMIAEILGSKFFSKKHMSAPIAYGLDCVLDIATLGANDFIDFLLSFYIEQGIQMIERTYMNVIMKQTEELVPDYYNQIKTVLSNVWDKSSIEEDTQEYLSAIRKENEEVSDSTSNIVLSDHFEESFESMILERDLQSDSAISKQQKEKKSRRTINYNSSIVYKTNQENTSELSFDETRDYDQSEIYFKNMFNKTLQKKDLEKKEQLEFDSKIELQKKYQESLRKKEMEHSQNEEEQIETKTGECVDRYADFVNGMIGPLVLPIIASECWIFYEQNSLANNYNIERQSYIYYFLFTVIIIPFRLAIDIVYYHLWVAYHDVDFLVYAGTTKRRFENRRKIWKAEQTTSESEEVDEDTGRKTTKIEYEDSEEEEELRDLDKWCFSSQYYFLQSLFLIGMMNCVIGIYGVTSTSYNLFRDRMLVPIIILWYFICLLVHKLCLYAGKYIGVWSLPEKDIHDEANQPHAKCDNLEEGDLEMAKQEIEEIQQRRWQEDHRSNKFKEIGKKEAYLKLVSNLQKSQFENVHFRKNFILSNKKWLKNNIAHILNKDAKEKYRDIILEQMELIDTRLKKRRNLQKYLLMKKVKGLKKTPFLVDHQDEDEDASEDTNKHKLEDSSDIELDNDLFDFEEDYLLQANEPRYNNFGQYQAIMQPNRPTEIPHSTKLILRYWLYRSRNHKKARALVGGIIDRNISKNCQFCGESWGLMCQPEKNVEDLFIKYLKQINQKNIYTDRQKDGWQDYFQKHCSFRTECLQCNQTIADHYYQQLKWMKEKLKQSNRLGFGDTAHTNPSLNFLFEEQEGNEDTSMMFNQRTRQNIGNQVQSLQNLRQNTIISFQQKQSIIPSEIGIADNKDDYNIQQTMLDPNQVYQDNQQPRQMEGYQRGYRRQLSISRFRQFTPISNQRTNLNDGTNLFSNQSTARMPLFQQMSNEFPTNQFSQNIITESELFSEGNKILQNIDSHQNFDQIDLKKQTGLLGDKGILQIKQKIFSDFDLNTENVNSSNQIDKSYEHFDPDGSNLNTSRKLIQNPEQQQNNHMINSPLKIDGLIASQISNEQYRELDWDEKHIQQYYKNRNRDLINSENQNQDKQSPKQQEINLEQYKIVQNKQLQQPQNSQNKSSTLLVKLKLQKLCRVWLEVAQARLHKSQMLKNSSIREENL